MKIMNSKIKMKQRIIPGLGAFIESLYTVLPIMSVMNFVAIAIVLYTDVRPYLQIHFPWVTLWMFMLLLIFVVSSLMLVAYLYILPSMWEFREKQMRIIDEIQKLLEEIRGLKEEKK